MATGRSLFRRHRIVVVVLVLALVAFGLGLRRLRPWASKEERGPFRLRGDVPAEGTGFAFALEQSLGVVLAPGHEVRLVPNGDVFAAIEGDIRAATSSVHIDVFIWQKGKASEGLLRALEERKKGVACRVLADDAGSPGFDADIAPRLVATGCEARVFRRMPVSGEELARNHRKIVVVDGTIAYTGGFGVRDEWLGDGVTNDAWRDANVRFAGPAVRGAQQAIAENWQESGGTLFPPEAFPAIPPRGPTTAAFVASTGSPVLTRAERLVQLLVQAAKKRLWIANAYFVPPDTVTDMLKAKAAAGVEVRLLVPGKKTDSNISMGSQKMEYGSLLEKGVRVFEYEPSMMHAKTMLVDDEVSLVSSINLDPLSFGKLEEGGLVVQDRAFAAEMARVFEADLAHARPVSR